MNPDKFLRAEEIKKEIARLMDLRKVVAEANYVEFVRSRLFGGDKTAEFSCNYKHEIGNELKRYTMHLLDKKIDHLNCQLNEL
jgi:hypothetical protein